MVITERFRGCAFERELDQHFEPNIKELVRVSEKLNNYCECLKS